MTRESDRSAAVMGGCHGAAPAALVLAAVALVAPARASEVRYTITLAGLPIGSAALAVRSAGGSAEIAVNGRIGGVLDLGSFSGSGAVGRGGARLDVRSGSGRDLTTAALAAEGGRFTYVGETSRGPARVAMTVREGRVTDASVEIPDHPAAVRVPVTEAHRQGVVHPLAILSALVRPDGRLDPEGVCGRRFGVFTGQVRFDLSGTGATPAASPRGLPAGWQALTCQVHYQPVAGHRIDKRSATPRPRTATLIFARSPDGARSVLWSLAVPAPLGSFQLTATGLD